MPSLGGLSEKQVLASIFWQLVLRVENISGTGLGPGGLTDPDISPTFGPSIGQKDTKPLNIFIIVTEQE